VGIHASHIPPTSLGTLAVGVVTVAALYFGREVVVPMALAILLGFALAPLVLLLRRWQLGRVPPVIAVVVLAFLMIVGIVSKALNANIWIGGRQWQPYP
jgi:predicted PurR-regulated permease PerM